MSTDRPANETDETDEIEITPKMIEAGENAVWAGFSGGEIPADFSAHDLAISVYLAMHGSSRKTTPISIARQNDRNTTDRSARCGTPSD